MKLSQVARAGLALVTAWVCVILSPGSTLADNEDTGSVVEQGRAIAFDRRKGNCLACHLIDGGELAGNSGPPLSQMKVRFPDEGILRAQIWDATARNPASIMPPFGRHRILSEPEIDRLLEFLYTL